MVHVLLQIYEGFVYNLSVSPGLLKKRIFGGLNGQPLLNIGIEFALQ